MIRSMYSGVTGIKNHQVRMDTLSNNIANVNTSGYKSSRANFQDALYQTMRTEGESRNPSQIGLGMQVGSISVNFTQGPMLYTGRTLDVGIDGEGFFIVNSNDNDTTGENARYTRDGVFFLTGEGFLVNGEGLKVQYLNDSGELAPIQIALGDDDDKRTVTEIAIEPNGLIKGRYDTGDELEFVDDGNKIALATFPNQEGLKRMGQNLYSQSTASGEPTFGEANDGGRGVINSGYLEGSNVELTEEFSNMITTQRGYQANARVITTSDHLLEELINLKR